MILIHCKCGSSLRREAGKPGRCPACGRWLRGVPSHARLEAIETAAVIVGLLALVTFFLVYYGLYFRWK